MSQRRMFSTKITSSARFIKMPTSTQALYFHLSLNADDDGVVEAFPIIRLCNCSEDDLKILVAKDFVKVLNDDLVSYILDWREHNLIRADRKVDSMYKDLLLQIVPTANLIMPRPRAIPRAVHDVNAPILNEEEMADIGRPSADIGQHKRREEKLIEDNRSKDNKFINISEYEKPNFMNDVNWNLFIKWWKLRLENHKKLKSTSQALDKQLNKLNSLNDEEVKQSLETTISGNANGICYQNIVVIQQKSNYVVKDESSTDWLNQYIKDEV